MQLPVIFICGGSGASFIGLFPANCFGVCLPFENQLPVFSRLFLRLVSLRVDILRHALPLFLSAFLCPASCSNVGVFTLPERVQRALSGGA